MKRPIAVCRPSSGLVTTPSTMPIRKPADELAALLADALVEGLEVGEELLRRLVGGLAEGRHAEAAAAALAELAAEPALERGEMGADRRGGEIERELRVGEAVRLDQGDEHPEQAKVDRVEAAHASSGPHFEVLQCSL